MDNLTLRSNEMEALSAIYGDDWQMEQENVYWITLRSNDEKCSDKCIRIQFRFPDEYPLNAAPQYTVSAPWMSRNEKRRLLNEFDAVFEEKKGEEALVNYYLDIAREGHLDKDNDLDAEKQSDDNEEESKSEELNQPMGELSISHSHNKRHCHSQDITFHHGHPIIDRKSVFQAHLAVVTCVDQVKQAKHLLYLNKKVAAATHNISAYRIEGGPHNTCFSDCDDDGEKDAGPQLLHLLEILDVKNVYIVVSRWFGGILLGADRFKHIKNAARDLLNDAGYLDKGDNNNKESGKKKKGK